MTFDRPLPIKWFSFFFLQGFWSKSVREGLGQSQWVPTCLISSPRREALKALCGRISGWGVKTPRVLNGFWVVLSMTQDTFLFEISFPSFLQLLQFTSWLLASLCELGVQSIKMHILWALWALLIPTVSQNCRQHRNVLPRPAPIPCLLLHPPKSCRWEWLLKTPGP